MAKVLFTWELGRGLGHLVRYKALIASLLDDRHEVFYIARNAEKVRLVNPQPEIRVFELQPEFTPRDQQVTDPSLASYATLLFNCGFSDSERLAIRLRRWVTLLENIKPDCIIADHSPTVVLANRLKGIPSVVAGNGFTLPPATQPLRLFQPEHRTALEENIRFESLLCDIMNVANSHIAKNAAKIASPAELLEADQSWLMTFEDLDCYGERVNANYMGTYPNPHFGLDFSWPETPGPKVFAYLQSPKALEEIGSWARERQASLCLVVPGIFRKYRSILDRAFEPSQTFASEKPVNLSRVSREADLGISNGNANVLSNLALAGIPQMLIPISMENFMEARQAARISCGLMAPEANFSKLHLQLNELVDTSVNRVAAQSLAQKYGAFNSLSQTEHLRQNLYELFP
jgi:UDP-N-acetylglucosamine:LPS N-acetylglucosamine transferase